MKKKKEDVDVKKAFITNYFDALKIEKAFKIDLKKLDSNYIALQKVFHPDAIDKNALSNTEIEVYLEKIRLINKAYHFIKDPITRAQHLIELRGFDNQDGVPRDYLEQILDLQEKMRKSSVGEIVENLYKANFKGMEDAFEKDNYEKAQLHFLLLKYILRLSNKINVNQN